MIRQLPALTAARASGRGGPGGRARHVAGISDCARDVGQERGQVGIGPRGERLARPRAELVLVSRPCTNAVFSVPITYSRSASQPDLAIGLAAGQRRARSQGAAGSAGMSAVSAARSA